MTQRKVGNYVLKAQTKGELDTLEKHMNLLDYRTESFATYFHVWYVNERKVYCFPKEKYFVSRDGVSNYAIALLQYVGHEFK